MTDQTSARPPSTTLECTRPNSRNNVFGAAVKGKILVVRHSAEKEIMVVDPSSANGTIMGIVTGVWGFAGFGEPLDIAENCNGSAIPYVTEPEPVWQIRPDSLSVSNCARRRRGGRLGVATTSHCSGRSPADEASPR